MKKPNPERIRKHMARSTPDVIQRRFRVVDDILDPDYHEWVKNFRNKMRIKHADHQGGRIDILTETESLSHPTSTVLIIARWVPDKRRA